MKVHFIAIGGSAMHNLALALHKKGYTITGSDDVFYEPSKSRLEAKGLLPQKTGWFKENITPDIDFIILGMHAQADNIELIQAKEFGVTIYSYPEYLYEHSKFKTRVVIAGSHGKTTITSMILHVLNYHQCKVDYMVGAQLDGFDMMVHLSDSNDFMILEGDEYLTSAIDKRPKIHLYHPNIALISGIAWDHINVFPTLENYIEQFTIFINKITDGGILVYNEEDSTLVDLVEKSDKPVKKMPYQTPHFEIKNGKTYIQTSQGSLPLKIFGNHNLNNLAGAKWICQHIGIDEDDFYEAILSFKGASKRLEILDETENTAIYKDFAHSPSKVIATTNALKEQFPSRKLIACLELHTYSSLDSKFLKEYKNALDKADIAIIFYDSHALEIKRKKPISDQVIKEAFQRDDLHIFKNPDTLSVFLTQEKKDNYSLVFMSSGDFGGLDIV